MTKKGNRLQTFEDNLKEQDKTNKKNTKFKINYFRMVTIIIIILLIVYFCMSASKIIELQKEKDALLERKEELTQMKEELTIKLETINSEEYIEEQARRDLKLIKPNELLFVFSEEEENNE